ncbi:MAG: phnG [Ramlibacter sp.]|jgi:alpha-D-ribose 1-methylphosphonate 5-triphosphate synthase subunit PhnG|uniref:phosphonate C-P lyase system protein PhnG n=1 Tax=Ramlibacter sp. TaxID=1917967 RepID=UPI002605F904|nr:phosphonate C-P lyase system protein PhnG [Ramlibacter sp.]MDB5749985.1 phnG [Ramlibacter sp.]
MTVSDFPRTPRQRWLAVLARAPQDTLERAVTQWLPAGGDELVRAPECGMVMLRGRVGGTGDAFNLGEATVTRCAVRVDAHLGVGYVLGRSRRHAQLVATLDALLQEPRLHGRLLDEVIEPLARQQAGQRTQRSRELASSKVEFFTMMRGDA